MTDESGVVGAAPFSNEIIQILHMGCDGQAPGTASTLKGLEHVPPLPEFSSQRRHVSGSRGSAVQRDQPFRPDPVLAHDKVGHAITSQSAPIRSIARVISTTRIMSRGGR